MEQKSKLNARFVCLLIYVIGVIAATVTCVILMPYIVRKEMRCSQLDPIDDSTLRLSNANGHELVMHLNTRNTVKKVGKYYECTSTSTKLKQSFNNNANASCTKFYWQLQNASVPSVTDCFDYGNQSWFGGSILWNQSWPINGVLQAEAPYVPGDTYQKQYGGVMERFWISSGGFSIFIEDEVPLLVEMKRDQICLTGSLQDSAGQYDLSARNASDSLLAYTVCNASSARSLYESLQLWKFPNEQPARELFEKPIWSTWAYLKQNISSESVLSFAQNISNEGLTCSQIEIDDKWSTNYGDHVFDKKRFPDPANMVAEIHKLGYNVTAWVHPFINSNTKAFTDGKAAMENNETYLVSTANDKKLPALTSWWRGQNSTLVDVTKPNGKGAQELRQRLQELKNIGIDSFKFDGGEANWIPASVAFATANVNPGRYTQAWSEFSYEMDTELRRQETRIGYRAQHLPIIVRTMDKESTWGLDNGLKTVVTSALTHCLIGYNFFLPDMIGGNAYCEDTGLEGKCFPDKELYIRWLQVAVFMPSLQFSVPPWIYDESVVELTRSLLKIRSEQRFKQNMDKALADSLNNVPIVRPIWWIDPNQFTISDQFLLGDKILVAPVLEKGARSRSVYLPAGTWRPWMAVDDATDVKGPKLLDAVGVELNEVAAYYLISS